MYSHPLASMDISSLPFLSSSPPLSAFSTSTSAILIPKVTLAKALSLLELLLNDEAVSLEKERAEEKAEARDLPEEAESWRERWWPEERREGKSCYTVIRIDRPLGRRRRHTKGSEMRTKRRRWR